MLKIAVIRLHNCLIQSQVLEHCCVNKKYSVGSYNYNLPGGKHRTTQYNPTITEYVGVSRLFILRIYWRDFL